MPYAICLLYPPLSHTDYIQIYHLCLLGMMVSNAWHEADPHYAELVSVGIGSQPHSPPLPLPPFQIPSRYIKHLIFQSLVLPISTPISSIPGPYIYDLPTSNSGFPWWLSSKEPACRCRRRGLDPWVRKIPGEGNDNLMHYSCLGNPMDRGAWWAIVHGIAKESDRT